MDIAIYKTIASITQTELRDKGSRFIVLAYSIQTLEEAKQYVSILREKHHKIRHWRYTYHLGVDGVQFRANDDGESAGSTGRPILRQIDSAGLADVSVIVV